MTAYPRRFLALAAGALFINLGFADEGKAVRSFPLAGVGHLELLIPTEWRDDVQQPSRSLPPDITLTPSKGNSFQFVVTPLWSIRPGVLVPDREAIRDMIQRAADDAKPQAVEETIPLRELVGGSGSGYYFTATDKAPKPREFRYLAHGAIRVGDIALIFTVLTNDDTGTALSKSLETLKSSKYVANPVSSKEPARLTPSSAVVVTEHGESYRIAVPETGIVMTVPRAGLVFSTPSVGGATSNPRYFQFVDTSRGISLSGWFESASSYPGFDKFWERETEVWRKNGLALPRNVAKASLDGWELVTYDLPLPSGGAAHIRAEWVQDGTWIDVHLSVSGGGSIESVRATAKEVLEKIRVREVQ